MRAAPASLRMRFLSLRRPARETRAPQQAARPPLTQGRHPVQRRLCSLRSARSDSSPAWGPQPITAQAKWPACGDGGWGGARGQPSRSQGHDSPFRDKPGSPLMRVYGSVPHLAPRQGSGGRPRPGPGLGAMWGRPWCMGQGTSQGPHSARWERWATGGGGPITGGRRRESPTLITLTPRGPRAASSGAFAPAGARETPPHPSPRSSLAED